MGYMGELSGMYYDKEKNKYFRIQSNGATPSSSSYSSQDVKRRKLQDERQQNLNAHVTRQKGRIRRSPVLENPLTGGVLSREQRNGKIQNGFAMDGPQVFAGGLVYQGYVPTLFNSPIFTMMPRPDLGRSLVDFRANSEDQINAFLLSTDTDSGPTSHDSIKLCGAITEGDSESTQHYRFGDPGVSTSLSLHESSRRLAVTWMAPSSHSGIAIVPMVIPTVDDQFNTPTFILGPGLSHGLEVSILSSTAAPEKSPLLFAFGTSRGIMTVDKQNFDATFIGAGLFPHKMHPRDVFALEFLSEDYNILLSGGRSGILNITDLRIPNFGAQADFIRYPSSITHIRQLDAHRIIVAGLNSSLYQYDLRFRGKDTTPLPKSRNEIKCNPDPSPTKPLLRYPEYQNTATIQIGFDVDVETGIVAAAQEHDVNHCPVQLFSLHGGHTLRSDVSQLGMHVRSDRSNELMEEGQVVKCLRFARDAENRMKSLYVASPGSIIRSMLAQNLGKPIKFIQ